MSICLYRTVLTTKAHQCFLIFQMKSKSIPSNSRSISTRGGGNDEHRSERRKKLETETGTVSVERETSNCQFQV